MADLEQLRQGGVRLPLALAVAAASIVILTGVVACSDDGPSGSSVPAVTTPVDGALAPAIITRRDLDAFAADSPQRATLSWFQAIQFKDVSAASRVVEPAALNRIGPQVFRAAVNTVGSALGRPTFVATRRSGNQVAMRVLVVGYRAGAKPATSDAVTLYLRLVNGAWRISDLTYLLQSSNRIAEADLRRRGGRAQP